MSNSSPQEATVPFLLRVFYRNGSLYRPDEFTSRTLPPHLTIYATPDCTLSELSYLLSSEDPSLFPAPILGTRLVFQLVFPDVRSPTGPQSSHPPHQIRYVVKDLGSVVLGGDGAGTADGEEDAEPTPRTRQERTREEAMTLAQAKFIIGDYVSCAILPPLPSGTIAPAVMAKRERGTLGSDGPESRGRPLQLRENGFGRAQRDGRREIGASLVPDGEWRRGERLPSPIARQRGRGRRF